MADEKVLAEELLRLTVSIAAAYVSNNSIATLDIGLFIKSIHASLQGLGGETVGDPAVPVKDSVKPDYIVCLEDGRRMKMLKRYIRTKFGLTPEEYRAKWGLPPNYPMTAPNYAKVRSAFAKKIGLGTAKMRSAA